MAPRYTAPPKKGSQELVKDVKRHHDRVQLLSKDAFHEVRTAIVDTKSIAHKRCDARGANAFP